MNVTTLIRMLQAHHDKGHGDVPVAVHVSAEAGWGLVPLLDQVGALGSLDEPDAILLAAQADQLNPYDDADPPSGTARLIRDALARCESCSLDDPADRERVAQVVENIFAELVDAQAKERVAELRAIECALPEPHGHWCCGGKA